MNERYYSLDIFRGATVAFMIMVNNPGSWDHIYAPLEHAAWHGCTPTDLVFPFFLFAVGNAMAFVMPRLQVQGNAYFIRKVVRRTLLIFLIGLFLNWSPFFMWQQNQLVVKSWEWTDANGIPHGIRILGVLQRIAIAYCIASFIVFYFKPRGAYIFGTALLLVYWGLCFAFGSSGDPYSITGFFGTAIDQSILGELHMYHGEGIPFDPEGIISTITPAVQVIFGYLVSHYIQQKGKTYEMLSGLLIAGLVLTFIGLFWSLSFPLNKKIWTSSFTVYTTGVAILVLGILIYIVEFKHVKGWWSSFFDAFGKNPLFIFVLSGFLPRLLGLIRIPNGLSANGKTLYTSPFGWFYEHICKNIAADLRVGSLVYAFSMIAFYWLVAYMLNKRKIYIRV
ncbi:DUF5009 domain-containing protein [Panacibacter sp. DH6]|uniref:DUF5009 domain-containing protein n=1 Tax=Panacibacter microcysteis TaxID=2793269 RepID=A0A931GUU7_9BACT|nr:DUF5009 domain-containing protein [Panacibacter microcysteis]MBG9375745.1 DUF5009 domain-containing protein [Panacibacter microcysteis]